MIESGKSLDTINELYEIVINHRNVVTGRLTGTKDEIISLVDYIAKTGTNDEFIFKILRYRLENKTNMSLEQIEKFMKELYEISENVRTKK